MHHEPTRPSSDAEADGGLPVEHEGGEVTGDKLVISGSDDAGQDHRAFHDYPTDRRVGGCYRPRIIGLGIILIVDVAVIDGRTDFRP